MREGKGKLELLSVRFVRVWAFVNGARTHHRIPIWLLRVYKCEVCCVDSPLRVSLA